MQTRTASLLLSAAVTAFFSACASGSLAPELTPLVRQIASLEDARDPGGISALWPMLRHEDASIRLRAVRAVGRIGSEASLAPLCAAISDLSLEVRLEAIFWLGQTKAPKGRATAMGALLPGLKKGGPEERAETATAVSKLAGQESVEPILEILKSTDPGERGTAALSLDRLLSRYRSKEKKRSPKEKTVRSALIESIATHFDEEGLWQSVYALAKLEDLAALDSFEKVIRDSESAEARIFAVRGIALLCQTKFEQLESSQVSATEALLLWTLRDPDPRMRVESALALGDPSRGGGDRAAAGTAGKFQNTTVLEALARAAHDPNPVVARAAAQGLGHFPKFREEARQALINCESTGAPTVKAAAIRAQARLMGDRYAGSLSWLAESKDWRSAIAVADSLRFLSDRAAIRIARTLLGREDSRIQIATLSALSEHREDRASLDLLNSGLSNRDAGVREAAASTLVEIGDSSCLPALIAAISGSGGDAFVETRQEALRALARIAPDSEETKRVLRDALKDPAYLVRKVAHRELLRIAGKDPVPALVRPKTLRPTPLPGTHYPLTFLSSRPILRFETTKGAFHLALFPAEAPIHCQNLLRLVESGAYDGRIFHRVVPNFVIQGGDGSGTGSGAQSAFGGRIRDEINRHPYLTGTLGMPKSAEPDTGGEQIFITHIPTPHLDGRYTVFGQVTDGLASILAIEVGDRILKVVRER